MTEPVRVPVDQLREVFNLVLSRLIEAGQDTISLEHDHFWSIPADKLYDVYTEPDNLTIGQVSESWQWLQDLLSGTSEPNRHHLVWLADVLRAVGQQSL